MQKEKIKEIKTLIKCAMATTGPPLGPACGKFVNNLRELINLVNLKTKDYKGLPVYLKIILYTDRTYSVELNSIPLATRIKLKTINNTLTKEPLLEIAKDTYGKTDAKTLDKYTNEIKGTLKSHKIKLI